MNYLPKIGFYAGLILFVSCQSSDTTNTEEPEKDDLDEKVERNNDSTLSDKEKYEFENLKIEFDEAIVLNSTNNFAIPLIYDETQRDKMDYDRTHFNLAIFVEGSDTPVMAFPSPVMIDEIYTIERRKQSVQKYSEENYYYADDEDSESPQTIEKSIFDGLIFLETGISYDIDNYRTDLWIYDLKNLTLVQLNPAFTNVQDWKAFESSGTVMLRYTVDSNADQLLDDEDDQNMSFYNIIDKTNTGKIFDIELLKEMKSQVVKSH